MTTSHIFTVTLGLLSILHFGSCGSIEQCISDTGYFSSLSSDQKDSNNCTAHDGEVEKIITEASYIPPKTYPAPRSADLGSDIGEPQELDVNYSDDIFRRVERAREYLQTTVMKTPEYDNVRDICINKHASCAFWSVLGECENNPGYMKVNCGPVCYSCEMLHVDTRCPLDPDAIDAIAPGDLNKLFERIVSDESLSTYEPVVLSRPPEGPWVIQFENALSNEEADRLIELGGHEGYERSSDVGDEQADGSFSKSVNSGRTSTNAWCVDDCYEDPVAKTVMERIENITGVPEPNSENLQLLRYERSQFYQTHNDFIPYQIERQCGPRILTFYMYLNDVEDGGGTNFPNLDLTVTPKRGRAVLWPSVLDENPEEQDSRTNHQALPVASGVKYGANAWLHLRDFKTANANGCA